MNPAQLKVLIRQGESQILEFKQSYEALNKDVFETVCAFLNRRGGELILGVKDNGDLVGVNPDKLHKIKKEWVNGLNNPQQLSPPFDLCLEAIWIDDKAVLYCFVPESSQVHLCKGQIYDRHEDGDFKITHHTEKVAQLYQRKQITFSENTIYPFVNLTDLREDLLQRTQQRIKNVFPNHPWIHLSAMEMLQGARLYQKDYKTGDEGFTLAAVLLLGHDDVIQSILTHYRIDAILKVHNTDRYDDRLDIRTNLLDAYTQLMDFIAKHVPDPFYLEGDMRISLRDKIFREAVVNVLVHREYTQASPTRVVIEKDKVTFENPNRPFHFGRLEPNGFAPHPKNPLILKFFREISLAEELGSGIKNTHKYSTFYTPGKQPQFIEDSLFKTVIPIPNFRSDAVKETSDAVKETSDAENSHSSILEKMHNEIVSLPYRADYKQKLLALLTVMLEREGLQTQAYAEAIHASIPATKRYLQTLAQLELIVFKGASKTGGYYLCEALDKKTP